MKIISKETNIEGMKKSSFLEKHIGYWLRFLSNQVSLSFAHKLAAYNVSIAEWVVLNILSEEEQSPAILAQKIGLTRGAMSKILDKLLHKQWIDRWQSSADRRYQSICLSEKGKTMLPELASIADENDQRYFGHLSQQERKALMTCLIDLVLKNKGKDIPIN